MAMNARHIGLLLGPLAALAICLAPIGLDWPAKATAALALWMGIWWATEALPLAATALLPMIALPLMQVMPVGDATRNYAHPLIYLFLGGFMIALAMEKTGLHKRIALWIVLRVGAEPGRLVLGFMIATALLSMWISNTATTMMMLPIAISVASIRAPTGVTENSPFAIALMLGIAYAASIGGVGTLVGTPTNAAMAAILDTQFGVQIGFAQWMLVGLPVVAIMLPLAWLLLSRVLFPVEAGGQGAAKELLLRQQESLGPMSNAERRIAFVAWAVAVAWISRGLAGDAVPALSDTGIAMIGALSLFIINDGKGGKLLEWQDAPRLPWDIVILFGGGMALAGAMTASGLSDDISTALEGLGTLNTLVMMLILVSVIIFLTELTSNVATTSSFVPVAGALAVGLGIPPIMLGAPIAVASSCAFMLPVATPPNAIVFGSGYLTIPKMIRAGIWLNLASIIVVTSVMMLLLPLVFG